MKVSIIVPVYNCGRFLDRCLKSIINQTYKNIEIILIVSQSEDNSEDICSKYAEIDKRIKIIHQEKKGVATARNAGLDSAKGELIEFVDADDVIDTRKTEYLVNIFLNHDKIDIAICDYFSILDREIDFFHKRTTIEKNRIIERDFLIQETAEFLINSMKEATYIRLVWDKMYRTSKIREDNIRFEDGIHSNEDLLFNLRYISNTDLAFFLNEKLYTHYLYTTMVSTSHRFYENIFENYQVIFEQIRGFLINENLYYGDNIQKIEHNYISMVIMCLVRICRSDSTYKGLRLFWKLFAISNDRTVRKNLKFYHPTGKESKIFPFLIQYYLIPFIIVLGKYKAKKRYGSIIFQKKVR